METESNQRTTVEQLLMQEYRDAVGRLVKAEREFGKGLALDELTSVRRLEGALDALQAWEVGE